MTTLKNRISNDATAAMKAKDAGRLQVLRYVLGVIQTAEKKGKTAAEFTDEQTEAVIANIAKQNRDNISIYTQAGETEKVAEAENELKVLADYLPQQLTTDEIKTIIAAAVEQAGDNANMGTIMKIVVPQTRNKADGAKVKNLVLEALN